VPTSLLEKNLELLPRTKRLMRAELLAGVVAAPQRATGA
jgi:hypothetical protein